MPITGGLDIQAIGVNKSTHMLFAAASRWSVFFLGKWRRPQVRPAAL